MSEKLRPPRYDNLYRKDREIIPLMDRTEKYWRRRNAIACDKLLVLLQKFHSPDNQMGVNSIARRTTIRQQESA